MSDEVELNITEEVINVSLNITEAIAPQIRQGDDGLEISIDAGLTWSSLLSYEDISENIGAELDNAYVHDQSSANSVWTINHNLDRYPSVTIVDSSGAVVVGQAVYSSSNQIILTFSASFAGSAYLN